eukprot:12210937-Alexandrium_andersonii.AAC.1
MSACYTIQDIGRYKWLGDDKLGNSQLSLHMFKHLPDGDPRKSYDALLNILRWQIGQDRLAANRRASAQGPIGLDSGPAAPAPKAKPRTKSKA